MVCWALLAGALSGPQGAEPQAVTPAVSLRRGSGWTSGKIPRGELLGDLAGGSALVTPSGPESHRRGGCVGLSGALGQRILA